MAAIRERVAFLRRAHVAELVGMAGTMLGTIPTAAQVVVGPIISQLPLGLCNLICTNVPGPAFPLYLLGHKMLRFYPYVPIGGDIGINCAVLTYDGTAYFGFTGDVHAAPDLWRLEKFLTASFVELRKSLRIRSPRRKVARGAAKTDRASLPNQNPKDHVRPFSFRRNLIPSNHPRREKGRANFKPSSLSETRARCLRTGNSTSIS